ncbi:hypothetical protein TNIN_405501 [Trichonephila inaurata madagascariensis]|uniref:Uncharacterized protein n=1 Tax=Trichonephila inaurata madagascariensis TaxID=2747483 RepID=A0A8X6I8D1_9ARAC|nr:hypothetical protein TNIN_405501 [Trichonephila inaurata madagascariensis]
MSASKGKSLQMSFPNPDTAANIGHKPTERDAESAHSDLRSQSHRVHNSLSKATLSPSAVVELQPDF